MLLPLLPISLTLAAALALINLWLTIRTGLVRRRGGVWIGDGGDEALLRRMRAQANFVENAPFVLLLVLLVELAAGPSAGLTGIAGAFVVARLLHPFGLDGWKPGRMIGAIVTMLSLLALALWALALVAMPRHGGGRSVLVESVMPRG